MTAASLLSVAHGSTADHVHSTHLDLWQSSVAARPNATALISKHQTPHSFHWIGGQSTLQDHVQWTYSELDRAARRLATDLNRASYINRRPIVTLLNTQAEWALFFWAAAYLHAPLVPINPKTATRSAEIAHMIQITQPAVIITADSNIAGQLENSLSAQTLKDVPVKISLNQSQDEGFTDWITLTALTDHEPTPPDTPDPMRPEDPALILFTSGTTSLPKPCYQESGMVANAGMAYLEARKIDSNHRFIQHLPNFHAYGIAWSLCFWNAGGQVILPSESFEAQASLECFDQFKATHTSLVPTTAQAILAHPFFGQVDLSSLVSVDVSGAGVLPSLINACTTGLKVPSYTSYGMTESPGTLIWPEDGSSVLRDGEVLSGKPARGACVKVCEPGTRNPVPRGEVGELHNGGRQVVHGYADPLVSSSVFYLDDSGVQWVISGDQAVMEHDGSVRISGRYKDMIIRGGENISPASIEDYLSKIDGIDMAQVVGVPDDMAGEVPIAVITTTQDRSVNVGDIRNATSHDLGPAFAPKLILHLQNDLGLAHWQTTASGKVRKVELRATVRDYLQKQRESSAVDRTAPTVDSLIRIWEDISGHDGLRAESLIQSFADSLMMMQLSGTVKRDLGRDITVEDFKKCSRIQDQADLIDSKPERCATRQARSRREGPPAIDDMPHVAGEETAYEATKQAVCASLDHVGLEWSDVEDVMPLPDWDAIFCHRSRPTSWNLRFSWLAPVALERLEQVIKESLLYQPTLRSMTATGPGGLPLLVAVRNSDRWFNVALTTGWEVDEKEDLNQLLLDHPELDCASAPGPLVRIHLARIRSDNTSGMLFIGSHATNDMTMTKLWLDDILTLITGQGTLEPHASFKDYANAFHQHRNGVEAENGVDFWTHKLHGVSSIPESSLWPQQRAPEWFKGVDNGWSRWNGTAARPGERTVSQKDKRIAQKGIRRMVPIQDITLLKSEHDVPVFMLVKAAIALLNISQTGGKEAIFGTINAARTWPFSSDHSTTEREACSGNPLDIAGCTTEYLLDRVPFSPAQSLLQFMQGVTRDEEQNSAYAHTPFFRIVDRLRDPLSSDDTRTFAERERDAESILSLIRRQSFNWLPNPPGAQNPKGLKLQEMLTRMDNGLTITGFLMPDKKSVGLSFSWDTEHLSLAEANRAMDRFAGLVGEMGKHENWGSSVAEILRL